MTDARGTKDFPRQRDAAHRDTTHLQSRGASDAPAKNIERDGDWADAGGKPLSAAARRALREAEARRQARREKRVHDGAVAPVPREVGGRGSLDPVRYDDWEVKGIATDF